MESKEQLYRWPNPPEFPLYVSIEQASKIAGVSDEMMRTWANSQVDPIPQIKTGRKRLIRTAAIPEYAARKEYV